MARLGFIEIHKSQKERECSFCNQKIEIKSIYSVLNSYSVWKKDTPKPQFSHYYHYKCLLLLLDQQFSSMENFTNRGGTKGPNTRRSKLSGLTLEQRERYHRLRLYLITKDTLLLVDGYMKNNPEIISRAKARMYPKLVELRAMGINLVPVIASELNKQGCFNLMGDFLDNANNAPTPEVQIEWFNTRKVESPNWEIINMIPPIHPNWFPRKNTQINKSKPVTLHTKKGYRAADDDDLDEEDDDIANDDRSSSRMEDFEEDG